MSKMYLEEEKRYVVENENIYDYLTNDDLYLNVNNKHKYSKADKLRKMICIYECNENDYYKVVEMNKIYSTCEQYNIAIGRFILKSKDIVEYQEIAKKLIDISDYYGTNLRDGMLDKAKEYFDNKKYFDSLSFARDIINAYVNYNDSCFTEAFINDINIKQEEFDFSVEAVKRLDKDLYNSYLEVSERNKNNRIEQTIEKCQNLREGVKTGYLNNENFDELLFLKNLPFFTRSTMKEIYKDMNIVVPTTFGQTYNRLFETVVKEDSKDVMKKLIDYRISNNSLEPINYDYIYKSRFIKNGRELEKEDKDAVFLYIETLGLPPVERVFNVVKDKYLTDELDIIKAGNKQLVKTIKVKNR